MPPLTLLDLAALAAVMVIGICICVAVFSDNR